jgi:hypothetical protein
MTSNNDVRASWPGLNVEAAVTCASIVALWTVNDPMGPWRMMGCLFNIYLSPILSIHLERLAKDRVQWLLKEEIIVLLANTLCDEVLDALEGVTD